MKKHIIITVLIIILLIVICSVFVIYHKNINSTSTNNSDITIGEKELKIIDYNLFFSNDVSISELESINNIYYKKISNYEDYQMYKNKFTDMLNMTAEDFENNFMIVTYTENISTAYLIPYKIEIKDNTLYLGMKKDFEENPNNAQTSIILPKEADVENTIVYQCIDFTFPTDKYADITSLPKEYSFEQAQEDSCFISNSDGQIYNDEIFNSFLNAVSNNEDFFIRMVRYSSDNQTIITDIYYSSKDKVFYVCQDGSRAFPNTTYNYYKYTTLEKRNYTYLPDNRPIYYLTDETQDDFILYTR